MNKYEKLIEYIINDEEDKARALFHQIVVEKSRDIYESIMDEEVSGAQVEDMVDEVGAEESHAMEGDDEFSLDDEGEDDSDGEVSGDFPADGDHDEHEEHEELEDKIMSIDAKLDELLAKFDEIEGEHGMDHDDMGGDDMMGHDDMGHDDMGGDDMMGGDEGHEEMEEESMFEAKKGKKDEEEESVDAKKAMKKKTEEGRKSSSQMMREYVDKIGEIYGGAGDASEGDAVGGGGKKTSVNTKPGSVGPGANFGGNVIKRTGADNENPDGKPVPQANNEYSKNRGQLIGKVGNTAGGSKQLSSAGREYSKEHGAEGQTTDGKVPVSDKSVQKQNTGKK